MAKFDRDTSYRFGLYSYILLFFSDLLYAHENVLQNKHIYDSEAMND